MNQPFNSSLQLSPFLAGVSYSLSLFRKSSDGNDGTLQRGESMKRPRLSQMQEGDTLLLALRGTMRLPFTLQILIKPAAPNPLLANICYSSFLLTLISSSNLLNMLVSTMAKLLFCQGTATGPRQRKSLFYQRKRTTRDFHWTPLNFLFLRISINSSQHCSSNLVWFANIKATHIRARVEGGKE